MTVVTGLADAVSFLSRARLHSGHIGVSRQSGNYTTRGRRAFLDGFQLFEQPSGLAVSKHPYIRNHGSDTSANMFEEEKPAVSYI
jgi:hypothetical protein